MKTVTADYKDAQARPAGKSVRQIRYKRRYWVAEDLAYTWEADWVDLPEDQVISIGAITGKLDTDRLNEFKISNVTLTLKNEIRQWTTTEVSPIFGPDLVSSLGYEPYWTKFQIKSGWVLTDGTVEVVPIFVGVAVGYISSGNSDDVQVNVQGLEALLMNANAEDVSTAVTAESIGPGDGTTTDFVTDNPGVGIVSEVKVDGVAAIPGTDYSVDNLNSVTLGATISFETPPANGVAITATYLYWLQNQTPEALVSALLTAAGIPGADQNVDPVVFPGVVSNAIVIDSAEEWAAGTPSAIDYSTSGSIRIDLTDTSNYELLDDFSDGDYTANPAWGVGGGLTVGVSGNKLRLQKAGSGTHSGVVDIVPNNAQIGTWSWVWRAPPVSWPDWWDFAFYASSRLNWATYPFNPIGHVGNMVRWSITGTSGDNVQRVELLLNNSVVAAATVSYPGDTDWTFKVVRYGSGLTQVYVNGTLTVQATSAAVVSPAYLGFSLGNQAATEDHYFDDIKRPKTTFAAVWTSPTFDMTASVTAIGRLIADQAIGGGSILYETRTSANGSSWDAWTAISGSGQVMSDARQYIQIRATFSHAASSYADPVINSIRVEYNTTSTYITLGNFTGRTVYEAIQAIATFANYEWGFTAEEDFFFRSKSADTSIDETLSTLTNVVEVSNIEDGYDQVYSTVRVTYGSFTAIQEDDGATPEGPLARFGKRILEIDGGDLLIDDDTNIANGIVSGFYSAVSVPKRKYKAKAKLLEWLDLSDTVSLSYDPYGRTRLWYLGDPTAYLGDTSIWFLADEESSFEDAVCKVTGYRHDTEQKVSEFDLEEILT